MATCDHPSELAYRIAYPGLSPAGSRKGRPVIGSRAEDGIRSAPSSTLQGIEAGEVFHSLVASGNFRPRSRWAAVGAVAFQALVLVTLVVAPLYRTLPLPKRETVTMLYLQSPAAAGSNGTKLRAPVSVSTSVPTKAISAPVHTTHEAPVTPLATTGGVQG